MDFDNLKSSKMSQCQGNRAFSDRKNADNWLRYFYLRKNKDKNSGLETPCRCINIYYLFL